jgi:Carboxypeptidase regulatory-like domain
MMTLLAASAGARVHAGIPDKSDDQEAKVARAISGAVLDPSGASVAGAKVILATAGGETISTTTSDTSGGFRFEKVVQGSYQIRVQAPGFQDFKIEVNVGAKAPAPMQITLTIKVQNEVVTVGTTDFAPQVTADVSENQNANILDRSTLDRVPVFDQDYITTMSRFLDDSAAGTNGVTLIVNGIEANGPGVTPSAVQEVKINQNPYSARFARPGRARLEITMKGGTPSYHGSVNFMFRDSVFDAKNAFAQLKPPEQRRYYEGSLTGPVGNSKKTTFLLSLDRDEEDQQSIIVAQGVNGPINENLPSPTRHFFGSGRIFHDFANGDQFWIGYSYEQGSNKNVGVGGTVLPEAASNNTFLEHEINVSYRHVFSTKWVNQLRFLVGHFDRPITSLNGNPQIVVAGAFTGGGAQADSRRTEYHFDGTDIVTYVSGKHELNFGIDVPDISRRGEDDFTNSGGTYTFASLTDFAAGHPATFFEQRGQGHLVFLEKVLSGFIEDTMRLKPNFSVTVGARYYWQNYFHDETNNLAPRIGFAYAPTKNSKTVFRGGAGLFFDRTGPRPIADLLHFNGVNLERFIVENPSFPVTPAELTRVPTSEVVLDPRSRMPYTVQYSMGVERQVTEKSTFSATYVGSRGIDLYRSRDINAPPPPNFLARPDAALGQVRQIESEGYLKSNTLELTFRGRPSKYFTGQVQYTLGKTYNNTSGITYFPANSFNPEADWARSDFDRRHKFDLLGSTQASRFFTVGAALSLYSGRPVNVTTGGDNNHDGVLNDRPAGFARNTLHGPGTIELDLNLERDFLLSKGKKEGPRITVALNAFNVLNHTNDTTFVGTITSPFFGRAVAAQPPRRMQLNLQFKF